MKVYLLWRIDPHDDETCVMGVYKTKNRAEIDKQKQKIKHSHRKSMAGEEWFSFYIDEEEVIG